ncbi:hypothetical protein B4102_0225 [Heyndrickxia sporothermodurans]|uniref:Uncharacterized protein n=1 Tax=Heyndrickxia sporothermodurans TaxID=46224 RepID=A0A150KSU7_9BACI|nr:hypothetical protein [Heyndrickxia sporothermodurans]KYD02631.1 hypothetical protein B4102_0225 [Heyndrickxia sporothermodurans]
MYGKTGEVTSVNTANCTAKVRYDDENFVSDNLLIVGVNWVPKVGDNVFCSFTKENQGFIIGPIRESNGGE